RFLSRAQIAYMATGTATDAARFVRCAPIPCPTCIQKQPTIPSGVPIQIVDQPWASYSDLIQVTCARATSGANDEHDFDLG
ncbi:hypothetical protein THAOC_04070, partial [Thalassiosira oceanica]